MSVVSDEVRKMFAAGDTARDAGLTTPDDVVRFDDIQYGDDKTWQVLDVYRPKDRTGDKLPVLVNLHGGGWVYGDKDRYQFYCMSLAQQGFAVVNFTYRLAPEFKFPAPVEDANLVFHWIFEHIEEYGFDVKNIFATGDSAGATLLYQYATICTNSEYADLLGMNPPENLKLNAILLNCGQYETAVKDDPNDLTTALMGDYLPNGGTPDDLKLINALPYVTENFPPTYLMTASEDFLKEQAPIMLRKLEELNIPHEFKMYGGDDNPLPHVFHCNIKSEDAQACNKTECDFLKKYM